MMMSASKFICRFCNKSYPCGKSLGGHLRSHRITGDDLSESSGLVEIGGSSGYGLRTNPKKTKRFGGDSSSAAFHQQGCSNVCKECGKGFQSMKALCGHMACHSDKAGDWFDEDEEEEYGGENDVKQFKPISESDQSNGYSSVSEIEQEQEELAKCLMMLSRDSSDSFVTESKSSPIRVRVKRKLKSGEILADSEKSDSGYLRYDENENLEQDSFIEEQLKNKESGLIDNATRVGKKHEKTTKYGPSCPGGFSFGVTSSSSNQKHRCDVCFKEFDSCKALSGHKSASSCWKKIRTLWDDKNSNNDLKNKKASSSSRKSHRHECPICFRVFKSGQALGGHKRSHFLGISSERPIPLATSSSEINTNNKAPSLIDLNLPAPVEEDVNEEVRFVLF